MDIQTITANISDLLNERVAAAIAADNLTDEAEILARIKAYADKDAIEDAATLAAVVATKDAERAAVQAAFDAYKASHPDTAPPPVDPPPVDPPPSTGWPTEANTGPRAGVELTTIGSYTTKSDGEAISGKYIKGVLTIAHANVTVKDTIVEVADYYGIKGRTKPGLVMDYCKVDGKGGGGAGLDGSGFTVRNTEFCGWVDPINIAARVGPTLIEKILIWKMSSIAGAHLDCIQADGDFAHLIIRGSHIINEKGQTSCIMCDDFWGDIDDVLIDGNWLEGGGYTIYAGNWPASGGFNGHKATNIRITNNIIRAGQYGPANLMGNGVTWSGNKTAAGVTIPRP